MPTDPTRQPAHDQLEAPARQAEGAMGPEGNQPKAWGGLERREVEVLVLERGKSFGSELERGKSFGSELPPPRDMGPEQIPGVEWLPGKENTLRVFTVQAYRPDWASRAFRKALQGCE